MFLTKTITVEELGGSKKMIFAPPSHPFCHAPTVCETKAGKILIAFYAGSKEGAPDSAILGVALSKRNRMLSKAKLLVHVPKKAVVNPRIFLGPDGAIWLLFGVNYGRDWCSGDTYLFIKRSIDEGKTWSDMELFWEQKGLLGRNKPLHEGNVWIIPTEWERSWSAAFFRSEDNGNSWELTGDLGRLAQARIIQPALVRLSDGRMRAFMRSQEGWIYASDSTDDGKTWSLAQPLPIPNNNSGIDVLRLSSGVLLLACNPVGLLAEPQPVEEGWPDKLAVGFVRWGPRSPLVLKISVDDGKTWPIEVVLEQGPGEYSYPYMILGQDGNVHLVYTYRRRAIAYISFSEASLVNRLRREGFI